MKKRGSFEDLIYNDALARGQRPGQKRIASGWNVERNPKESTDPLQVPDHRFPWQGVPLPFGSGITGDTGYQGNDRGRFMGQSVRYEEILPRCEGKLSPLKWKNLTEEDRYTQRAWRVREASRPEPIQRSDAWQGRVFGEGLYAARKWIIWGFVFASMVIANGNGGRELNDMSQVNKNGTFVDQIPVLNYIVWAFKEVLWQSSGPARHAIWAEDSAATDIYGKSTFETRNITTTTGHGFRPANGSVPNAPSNSFRNANELYFDGAEGPDKIGPYNVESWKTGLPSKNPTIAGNNAEHKLKGGPGAVHGSLL